ncbi:MAG: OmpH family outer membrane protein [Bryobacteraceae bacterium]
MLRLSMLLLASLCAANAQTTVGIINIQNALIETAEIKKAQAEMEAKFKPRQQEMEALRKELAGIQEEIQSGKLTPQAAQELQITGQRKQRDLQRMGEDLQQEVERARNDILQQASARMQEVVRKLSEQKGLDVVLDVSNTVYFKPALDITKEAVVAYDAAHPAQ